MDNDRAADIEANNIVARIIRTLRGELAVAQANNARLEVLTADFARSANEWRERALAYRTALDAITRLPMGGCDNYDVIREESWTNTCERCSEAHDIARAALEGK